MKKCTWCGTEYPDETTSCALDGTELAETGSSPTRSSTELKPSVKGSAASGNPVTPVLGWFDRQFLKTNRLVLLLAGMCMAGPMLVLAILGFCLCSDPKARDNAVFAMKVAVLGFALGLAVQLYFRYQMQEIEQLVPPK